MKPFRAYLKEENVVQTKRKGLQHFQKMKPVEFAQWAKSVLQDSSGVLSGIKSVLKVDGANLKFGRDARGNIFIEGARTGPIFDDGAFSKYAQEKGSDEIIIARAKQYDDILTAFKRGPFMRAIPNNTKIDCEIFYNPMAEETEEGLKFVTISYDRNKIGSFMSILPYGAFVASTGETHPNEDEIISDLLDESTDEIKIINPRLRMGNIDIKAIIDPVKSLNDESIRILQSRKKADKPRKQELIAMLDHIKRELSEYLVFNPELCGLDKICDPKKGEGIVLHLPHGTFKITTPEFQMAHHGSTV